jgi:CHAT domain-containing protein
MERNTESDDPALTAEQLAIKRYLLGQLPEDQMSLLEERLLREADLVEELEIAEDELVDDYAAGRFSESEARQFEKQFLVTPERTKQLRFAEALARNLSSGKKNEPLRPSLLSRLLQLFQSPYGSPIAVAAVAVIVVTLGVVVWRGFVYQSDVDKGLVALNKAYSRERPIEARITQLSYAPFSTRRGASPDFDSSERDRAARILMDAAHDQPGPASYHALGKFHLANGDFDKAIAQLDQALAVAADKAPIYADLGAAWLEKAKADLDKAKSDPAGIQTGKSLEELGRSLEYLNQAIQLNPNSLEALFNRALCREYLKLPLQAEEDWRLYLQKDPSSAWAAEARRRLALLEDQKNSGAQTGESLLRDFTAAYQLRDEAAAWAAISHARSRAGNLVVEALLDDFLQLSLAGRTSESDEKMLMISYAGELESRRAGDRYTYDLAKSYVATSNAQLRSLAEIRAAEKAANKQYNDGEFETALDAYSKVKELFTETNDTPESLLAQSFVGYASLRINRVDEGVEIFARLFKQFERRSYRSLSAQALHALSDALAGRNESSKALDYASRGLQASQEIEDNANSVRCLGQSVSQHLALGNFRQSLVSFSRALQLAETIPREPRLVWPLYHEAALDFHFLGLPAAALSFEQEALRLANLSGMALLRSRSWERLGLIYSRQGDHQLAIESGEKALAEAPKVSGRSQKNILARSMLILGDVHREAGNFRKSIDYFDQSLAIYKDLEFDAYAYQAHKGKLLALIALGEDGVASAELDTALQLFEDQRKKIIEESNRNRFFDNGQDIYEVAIDFANSRRKDTKQAFAYAEDSRGRSLFEMISSGVSLAKEHENLDISLGAGSVPLTTEEIQARLPENAQLLEYAVLDEKVLMWVVTRSAINSTEVRISATELEQKIRAYAAGLSRPSPTDREAMIQAGKDLHSRLLAPVEKYLSSDRILCVIPDKSLNYLPFEALISASSGHYLIEDYSLQRAPSATIFVDSSQKAKAREQLANERLLSVGDPKFDAAVFGQLSDLPGAAREAKRIAGLYRPAVSLIAEAATAARVKRGLMEADVVHLATHAVANERSPLLSKLLLTPDGNAGGPLSGPDGVLQASEVYQMQQPRARLVVLSACQTGIERSYRGEGAIGFARPFIAAGVPLVVASLWPVDSDATAELMISFHQFRKQQHLSTVAALRQAQLKMIAAQQSSSEQNYAWAAFTTIGGYATF